ncbi:DUF4435 domain-containing protein [Pseudoalteromonas carrageenovora]|uniref:DUF4435 domain-containing protein n=1 Tax=Pseudoalteromonas TaxID=53246 RepID=UPI0026E4501A|nr:DUF4435 domain-containing protein [Pseudoalteromonas carrageenovora]MDO6636031.1 DUF4435 domain-containing protein [Pseudoalteromonas carrageenovora]MDO6646950.1 DUF4435 domain-containing protein [Pseudoalteromonas carrageenovora]
MQNSITPVRIANAIQQDSAFNGTNILVEGENDIKLYRKLTCKELSKIKVTFGKKKMREVYALLRARGFGNVLGIRDADFLRINGKLDITFSDDIFITDKHDSEGMIIESEAFTNFLLEIAKEEKLANFFQKNGCLRSFIYNLSKPLACLRMANKEYDLGLSFKPVKPEGNTIKFKKFICEKTLSYLGHDVLVNTVVEYSKNRGSEISTRTEILSKLEEIINLNLPIDELVNGHDLSEILFIVCKKGLKSSHSDLKNASSVETMLRLAYSKDDFSKTQLFKSLQSWEKSSDINILSPMARG